MQELLFAVLFLTEKGQSGLSVLIYLEEESGVGLSTGMLGGN